MAVRFDDDERSLRLSVADLLEGDALGSLGFGNRGGYERLWVGQAIHSRYQNRALEDDPTYRKEVWLELPLTFDDWEVVLVGRLDGMRREPDGTLVVEEIKSVRRAGHLSPSAREAYERQARIYAWMLHRLEGAAVQVDLVLIEIGSRRADRVRLELSHEGVEAGVRRRLGRLLSGHERQRRARAVRHEAAARLSFPYAEQRPGQQEIIERVEMALRQREHLLVEATTGLGKTVATLFPVLRFATLHDKRVFVLTAKNLQQEMAGRVLGLLNSEGAFHSLQLRAKARMCANDQLLCHEEYCAFARDYFFKLQRSALVPRLLELYPDLRPDAVFAEARACELCPFEVSLELARNVQTVICDYNYVFEPYVSLAEFRADNDLRDTILVIDEAHNLVDRGRGYYSPELREEQALLVAADDALGDEGPASAIRELAREMAGLVRKHVELAVGGQGYAEAQIELPEEDLWALRPELEDLFSAYLEHRRETRGFRSDDPFVALYFDCVRFLDAAGAADDRFSFLGKREPSGSVLKILCRDASRFLGETINRTHSTIALSATLSPADFYLDLLGIDRERSSSLSLPSPFPPQNRRVVIDAEVTTTWRLRQRNYPRIAQRLAELAREIPGNCLVLFPSYSFLEEVAARLPRLEHQVIVQRQRDASEVRESILEHLRGSLFGRVLLLSVAGGVFAEGVDYPGDVLQAVVVVGPCLPTVGLEQRLLQEHYEDRYEKGFEYAYVIPGMTRVVQAAGRLIRSSQDRGVIALLDHRFLRAPYVRYLPDEWIPQDGPSVLAGEPAAVARQFFSDV